MGIKGKVDKMVVMACEDLNLTNIVRSAKSTLRTRKQNN